MLTITQLPNKQLSIKSDYYYRDRIKQIPTARFDPNRKEWIIDDFMLGTLEERFAGELSYKTPRWVILGEAPPNMAEMYKIHNQDIKAPGLKLKPYDYQDFGIRFGIDKILTNGMCLIADSVGLGNS